MVVIYALIIAAVDAVLVTLPFSLTRRVHRPWSALFVATVLAAATFPPCVIGAVQPYPARVLVLCFDFLILTWTFGRFDALTLFVAAFTTTFFWQNYSLLVMFRQTGSLEEWLTFAAWGLCIVAATAAVFQSSLAAAYRRIAIAFQ